MCESFAGPLSLKNNIARPVPKRIGSNAKVPHKIFFEESKILPARPNWRLRSRFPEWISRR
jgi:hypothetical protein